MRQKWKLGISVFVTLLISYLFYPIFAPFIENRNCEFKGVSSDKRNEIRHAAKLQIAAIKKRAVQEKKQSVGGVLRNQEILWEYLKDFRAGDETVVAIHELMIGFGGIFVKSTATQNTKSKNSSKSTKVYFEYKMAPFYYGAFWGYFDPKTLIGGWGRVLLVFDLASKKQLLEQKKEPLHWQNYRPKVIINHPNIIDGGSTTHNYEIVFRNCPPLPKQFKIRLSH